MADSFMKQVYYIESAGRNDTFIIRLSSLCDAAIRYGYYKSETAFHDRIFAVANSLDTFEIKREAFRRVMQAQQGPATEPLALKIRALILEAIVQEHAGLLGHGIITPQRQKLETIVFGPRRK